MCCLKISPHECLTWTSKSRWLIPVRMLAAALPYTAWPVLELVIPPPILLGGGAAPYPAHRLTSPHHCLCICFLITLLPVFCTSESTREAVHRENFLLPRLGPMWETRTHSEVMETLRLAASSSELIHLMSFGADLPKGSAVCRSRD